MNAVLSLAERYTRFREDVFYQGLAEPEAIPQLPVSEQQLQSLWFGGEFGTQFTTTDGQSVEIRDFGTWNSGAGADFTGCTILLNGEKLSGDIELDPDVRDWERHGHSLNETFSRVVLHLFLHTPAGTRSFTRTVDHKEVPQVQLNTQKLLGATSPRPLAAAKLGRCATPLAAMSEDRISNLLQCAAQHRLQRKSTQLHALVAAQGRDQALYQALAGTLGYRHNTPAFQLLAQRLPLRMLLPLESVEREALLMGVSAFTEDTDFDEAREDTRGYLRQLWSHWWKHRGSYVRWLEPTQRLRWKLAAVRPGNHPQRRLGALAAILSAWGKVSHPLHQPEHWQRESWVELLSSLEHDYWSTHYTLLAEPAKKPIALIGLSRTQEILANVVYPLLVPERPELWQEYLDLPVVMDNQKILRAKLRLFGPGSAMAKLFDKKLYHHQGLLQVFDDFCMEDDSACADCPFPERLAQWSA
jgi:hypothetical protein